jgi:hypothetical protein
MQRLHALLVTVLIDQHSTISTTTPAQVAQLVLSIAAHTQREGPENPHHWRKAPHTVQLVKAVSLVKAVAPIKLNKASCFYA